MENVIPEQELFLGLFLGPNAQAKAPLGVNPEVVPGAESPSGGLDPDDPPGNNRESCFLLKLAKICTLILEKRITPDFKTFSLGKKKMKKQNEKNIFKKF